MPQEPFSPTAFNPFAITTAEQFARNPEKRCPCALVLDVSASMDGEPLRELQAGLNAFRTSLQGHAQARQRVEPAIVTFGGSVQVVHPFMDAELFNPPELQASGNTPMGQAIMRTLDLIEERKAAYQQHGVPYYRPWIFLITDGEPTDQDSHFWREALQRIRDGTQNRKFMLFAIGVKGANMNLLRQLSDSPKQLQGLAFVELFQWLSNSLGAVTQAGPGQAITLAPTTWEVVDT
jgi:uncharacterized protein YegL